MALAPVYYKPEGETIRLYVNVTNEGLSDMHGAYDIQINDKGYSLVQGGNSASSFEIPKISKRQTKTQELVVRGFKTGQAVEFEVSYKPFSSSP